MRFFATAIFAMMQLLVTTACGVAQVDFREHVAPILQTHCFHCHNNTQRKGEFSLEDESSMLESGYVTAGASDESHLLQLIVGVEDLKPEMPKTGRPLTDPEIETLKQWIDSGANWPKGFKIAAKPAADFDWWSLQPLVRPEVPQFSNPKATAWVRTPVDAFVLQQLESRGLSPSPEADRQTLIRRLYYDLTGLPPTIEQIVAFENDTSVEAYEKLVDRLLDSPRYGERWARHWLDVVKYADTCGYDKDKLRPNAWPYRDYVIRAFNEDKPYRRFVREQIAGDVLFPNTADGILGLGFIAAGPWDFIGHVEVPESKIDGKVARNLDRDDMVANALNTFCSVTIQCARCHDHKFDPFTQEQYYGLQAVFAAVDRADRVYDLDPEITKQRSEIQYQVAEARTRLGLVDARISELGGDELRRLDQAISDSRQNSLRPEYGYHSEIAALSDVEKWVGLKFEKPISIDRIVLRPCLDEFNGIGAGFGFPVRFRLEVDGKIVFDQLDSDLPNPQLNPVTIPVSTVGTQLRIFATKLAERRNDFHLAIAELQVFDEKGDDVASQGTVVALDSIEAPVRWRKSNLNDGIWPELGKDQTKSLLETRTELLKRLVGESVVGKQLELQKQFEVAKKRLSELPPGKLVYAASTDFAEEGNFKPTRGTPREIRFLTRGDVTSAGDLVEPGVLPLADHDLFKIPLEPNASESDRRAALAQWLTRDDNPLVWRSIVNRVWHYHFGRGIVDSPNDIGRMSGERSHPELIEWLAAEFRDGDATGNHSGSFKQLHRLLVTSSVYRQSSIVDGSNKNVIAAIEIDSGNRLLWKMNRRRLSAEEIRDSILMASGVLDLTMGGPGYYLFALEKIEHSPHYEYHKFDHSDHRAFRRSIYRFIVRSQPNPFMTTLDCADSSQSTPARNETQTPLQSLTLLNSDFNLAMAEKLAARARQSANSVDEQVEVMVKSVVGRVPREDERKILIQYAEEHGLENLARIMFNLSEFVYVD